MYTHLVPWIDVETASFVAGIQPVSPKLEVATDFNAVLEIEAKSKLTLAISSTAVPHNFTNANMGMATSLQIGPENGRLHLLLTPSTQITIYIEDDAEKRVEVIDAGILFYEAPEGDAAVWLLNSGSFQVWS